MATSLEELVQEWAYMVMAKQSSSGLLDVQRSVGTLVSSERKAQLLLAQTQSASKKVEIWIKFSQ